MVVVVVVAVVAVAAIIVALGGGAAAVVAMGEASWGRVLCPQRPTGSSSKKKIGGW